MRMHVSVKSCLECRMTDIQSARVRVCVALVSHVSVDHDEQRYACLIHGPYLCVRAPDACFAECNATYIVYGIIYV
jgi:hypothetical protein